MEWLWLLLGPVLLIAALVIDNLYRGRHKPKPPKVYQEAMTRRHTPKRIADTKLEIADWEVEFTTLELELALNGFAPLDGTYVSSSVLTWCYEHDRARFDIFMAHNNRVDMQYLGYSGAQTISDI